MNNFDTEAVVVTAVAASEVNVSEAEREKEAVTLLVERMAEAVRAGVVLVAEYVVAAAVMVAEDEVVGVAEPTVAVVAKWKDYDVKVVEVAVGVQPVAEMKAVVIGMALEVVRAVAVTA
jgi:hypothetical protein